MTVSNGQFTPSAGALSGAVTLNGVTLGSGTLSSTVTTTLNNITQPASASLTNQGTIVAIGNATFNGSFTNAAGGVVEIQSSSTANNVTLTANSGLTNAGTVDLTNTFNNAGFGSTLTVTGGALVNQSGATLSTSVGSGGGRTINAQFDNQAGATLLVNQGVTINSTGASSNEGTITANAGLTIAQSGTGASFTNTGSVSIASGQSLTVNSGQFIPSAGALSGAVTLNGVTLGSGTFPSTVTTTLNNTTQPASASLTNRGTIVAIGNATFNGSFANAAGGVVEIQSSSQFGNVTLTASAGLTNAGIVDLTNTFNNAGFGPTPDGHRRGAALVNQSGATLSTSVGMGGVRTINAQFDNQSGATLLVNQGVTINRTGASSTVGPITANAGLTIAQSGTGASFTNTGSVSIASGQSLTVSNGQFIPSAGALSGAVTLTGVTLGSGTLPSTVTTTLNNTTQAASASLTNLGTIVAIGNATFNGSFTNAAGGVVEIQSSSTANNVTLTANSGLTNAGTVDLTNTFNNAGFGSTLTVTGGALVNQSGATLSTSVGMGGVRTINAQFDNQSGATLLVNQGVTINSTGASSNEGTITANAGLTISQSGTSPSFTNNGTISVATSQTFSISGGSLANFSGGALTGGMYDVLGTFQFPNAAITTNIASIILDGTGSKIVNQSNVNALVGLASNSVGGSLILQDGRTFTSAGAFANAGTLTVNGPASRFTVTGAYTQSGGSTNLNNATLTSTTSSVAINGGILGGTGTITGNVTNGGQVIPGSAGSGGVLGITGSYTQTSSGSLTANLGGPNPGSGYSQLSVGTVATLNGTLNVDLIGGFAPGNGATFQVLNYSSNSGQFASIIPQNFPIGTNLSASYAEGSLILTTSISATLVSVAVTPSSPSVAEGLTAPLVAIGTYSDDSTANLTNLVTWASSSTGVATISNAPGAQGAASAMALGTTSITATLGSIVSPGDTLTVIAPALVSIAVTPTAPSVAKGLTQQFTATGTYTDGSQSSITSTVTWVSFVPGVASINASGLAMALATGTTSITATLGSVASAGDTLTVTPATLVSIAVTPTSPVVAKGQTEQFTATGTYSDGSETNLTSQVTWASATPTVATLNGSGAGQKRCAGHDRHHRNPGEHRQPGRHADGHCAGPDDDCRHAGEPDHHQGSDAAVHRDRHRHRRLPGQHHQRRDLGVVEFQRRIDQQLRRGLRVGAGHDGRHRHSGERRQCRRHVHRPRLGAGLDRRLSERSEHCRGPDPAVHRDRHLHRRKPGEPLDPGHLGIVESQHRLDRRYGAGLCPDDRQYWNHGDPGDRRQPRRYADGQHRRAGLDRRRSGKSRRRRGPDGAAHGHRHIHRRLPGQHHQPRHLGGGHAEHCVDQRQRVGFRTRAGHDADHGDAPRRCQRGRRADRHCSRPPDHGPDDQSLNRLGAGFERDGPVERYQYGEQRGHRLIQRPCHRHEYDDGAGAGLNQHSVQRRRQWAHRTLAHLAPGPGPGGVLGLRRKQRRSFRQWPRPRADRRRRRGDWLDR